MEGISKAKFQVIHHLATTHETTAILLQETHSTNPSSLYLPSYTLAAHTTSSIYGLATFVCDSIRWHNMASSAQDDIEWTSIHLEGVTITNVYKPPGSQLSPESLPHYPQPCIYSGDFNCHSTTWGYCQSDTDGNTLEDWASITDLSLLYDPKQPASFHSGRWGTFTNTDLAFFNLCANGSTRRILRPFPKSQHRQLLIETSATIESVPTRPVKRWNFRKASWRKFSETLDVEASYLSSPVSDSDSAYSTWYSTILSAAKASIPCGCRQA